ncbi:MAG: hypothetical protein E7277_06790, partial [Lachnospiraceae bacterium]|nr:hypothetical protein [Lachnospiraceae bacterium]
MKKRNFEAEEESMGKLTVRLEDFCDLEKLSDILNKWTNATHTAIALVDVEKSKVIMEFGMGTCCGCIRDAQNGKEICKKEWEHTERGFYQCPAGMQGFVLPIDLSDGERVAYLYAGGVYLTDNLGEQVAKTKEIMRSIGIGEEVIGEMVDSVVLKTRSEMEGSYELLAEIVEQFVGKYYSAWVKNKETICKEQRQQELEKSLENIGIGTWSIEKPDGEPWRFYGDHWTNDLLGVSNDMDPRERYNFWVNRVVESSREAIINYYHEVMKGGHVELTYEWNHPNHGRVYMRCDGSVDKNYQGGIAIRGYQQNITDKVISDQMMEDAYQVVRAFSALYSGTWKVDVYNDEMVVLKPHYFEQNYVSSHGNSALVATKDLVKEFVDEDCYDIFDELGNYERTAKRLRRKRSMSWEYRGKDGYWYRITAVPLKKGAHG